MNYNTNTNKFYAVICCIVKDEGYDLIHWVNYHFAIGFDKIYIFDNNSKISIKTTLADYMRCGIIEVQDITLNEFPQLSAYAAFLKKFGEDARWVAFIDADEYINIKSKTDISEFLEEYETYPAVGISWKVFGSNGNIKRPSLGPDKAYTTCLKEHSLIKSIIQPAMTEDVISPHHFIYKNNTFCVNEHCIPIIGPRSYHTSEKIQINHYYYKSQQDFENKISRGLATPMQNKLCYKLEEFYEQSHKQGELEKSIQRFSKKTDFYSKMGAKFISDEILDKISVNVQELLKEIATNLIQKKNQK
ncbi:glycosyltransferase family 92 protein [Desulfovibrio sp. UCD-KL4C]|uniref:glycosyltransferase family 92 protein n=1 Tax=Desulfovibrio sp. UCD-KL4C TaxID=2578120 RepID=UPI0025C2E1A1|nr:glycosyltransferase family 92 protein [Desulfovibrio sp. UCD-KL4C]